MQPVPGITPNSVWATALSSLTRMECKAISDFFSEAGAHFSSRLSDMRANAGEGPHSDEEIDHYVDIRDELEAFELTNRYFALVQAAGIFERVSTRLLEVAVNVALLPRSLMYAQSGFINARSVSEGYRMLNITLPQTDLAQLTMLTSKRNLILHSGGRLLQPDDASQPLWFLEVADGEVREAISLVGRCAESRIRQFQKRYCTQTST